MHGHVKIFSPVIVSMHGSSNALCFASGSMADTAFIDNNDIFSIFKQVMNYNYLFPYFHVLFRPGNSNAGCMTWESND